jgi:hypothetical protein
VEAVPIKRRAGKARLRYSDTIERLIAGQAIEWTAENDGQLVGAMYFQDPAGLPDAVLRRASRIVLHWREVETELRRAGKWTGPLPDYWSTGDD